MRYSVVLDNDRQGHKVLTVLNVVNDCGHEDTRRILTQLNELIESNNLPITAYVVDNDTNDVFYTVEEMP